MFLLDMKEVDEMNERDNNQVKDGLCELFVTGQERTVAFDFTHDKQNLDLAGLILSS